MKRPRQTIFPQRSRSLSCGFTLVEMLVVIGVVTLLIAMLLPALTKARQSVNALKCMSNLRQIGLAELQYANENRGRMVPAYVTYGGSTYSWPGLLAGLGYLTAPPTSNNVIDQASMSTSPYGCPDGLADAFANVSGSTPTSGTDGQGARPNQTEVINLPGTHNYIDFWYGCNASSDSPWFPTGSYRDFPNWSIPASNDPNSSLNDWPRLSDIKYAAMMVDKLDGCALNNPYNSWRFHARHFNYKSTNVLFYDGHVRTIPFAGLPQPKASGGGNGNWSATGLKSSTPEPDILFLVDQVP